VYEFDIQPTTAGATEKEVKIDANTGALIAIEDD
jgi:uncharacterized membrane protein YkoI